MNERLNAPREGLLGEIGHTYSIALIWYWFWMSRGMAVWGSYSTGCNTSSPYPPCPLLYRIHEARWMGSPDLIWDFLWKFSSQGEVKRQSHNPFLFLCWRYLCVRFSALTGSLMMIAGGVLLQISSEIFSARIEFTACKIRWRGRISCGWGQNSRNRLVDGTLKVSTSHLCLYYLKDTMAREQWRNI